MQSVTRLDTPLTHGIDVVGYHDLDGRPAFKLALQESGGRWFLYLAHLWDRGWSILDVTDPRSPSLVRFIPGPPNTWTLQVQVAAGRMITGLERIPPPWGGRPDLPHEEGFIMWDVSDPTDPVELGRWQTGSAGTHRNFYDGGDVVHAAAAAPGLYGKCYRLVDVSDPEHPTELGRHWLPEQESDTGLHYDLHGPAHVEGNLAYGGYGAGGAVIVDVSDPRSPTEVSRMEFRGISNAFGIHTYLPLPGRGIALVNDEAILEDGNENLNLAGIIDVSDPAAPRLISLLPQPRPPEELGLGNFFERGARFGAHNHHHPNHHPDHEHRDDITYLTYFNAGLRVYDISDPRAPRETAWFLPPDPERTVGPKPTRPVAQSEDVLVDRRGYIYVSHKSQGIWVLRLADGATGP